MKKVMLVSVLMGAALFNTGCCLKSISLKPVVGFTPGSAGAAKVTAAGAAAGVTAKVNGPGEVAAGGAGGGPQTPQWSLGGEINFEFKECENDYAKTLTALLNERNTDLKLLIQYPGNVNLFNAVKQDDTFIAAAIAQLGTDAAKQKAQQTLPAPVTNAATTANVVALNSMLSTVNLAAEVISHPKKHGQISATANELNTQLDLAAAASRARRRKMHLER